MSEDAVFVMQSMSVDSRQKLLSIMHSHPNKKIMARIIKAFIIISHHLPEDVLISTIESTIAAIEQSNLSIIENHIFNIFELSNEKILKYLDEIIAIIQDPWDLPILITKYTKLYTIQDNIEVIPVNDVYSFITLRVGDIIQYFDYTGSFREHIPNRDISHLQRPIVTIPVGANVIIGGSKVILNVALEVDLVNAPVVIQMPINIKINRVVSLLMNGGICSFPGINYDINRYNSVFREPIALNLRERVTAYHILDICPRGIDILFALFINALINKIDDPSYPLLAPLISEILEEQSLKHSLYISNELLHKKHMDQNIENRLSRTMIDKLQCLGYN
jgi:hypothetical protein